jgi:hypothetical protein
MLALRRDAHRERDAFVIARAARAAFAFALYARDCAREPAPNDDETTDDDGARDDDDAFNSRAVGVARRRRRNEGRARGTRARTRGERTRRRRARETRRALARAFDARAFERLRPRRVVMTLGTTATRTREAYEMDLRGVAYAETTTTTTTTTREDEREETADAVSRRAVRAFVPVMATLNPPQSAGLRAFFFVEARATTDEVEGYAPKPGFAPGKRARVERRRVRVVVNGDASDDRDDASDDESSDDLVWYQADAAVRAASSSMI